ncbi:MAG: 4Fe-4S dicluster domain-containing protein [Proteobacteria bacterium]|nr:4Fe-4S dicluster domain-containing protein [Pseudomonadota bacterium]
MVEKVTVTVDALQALLDQLKGRGYRVIGPTVRDQTIVYDEIDSLAELPRGWTDEQEGGHYRLVRREDDALFGFAVGPHSWKKFLHAPIVELWKVVRNGEDVSIVAESPPDQRFAFIGVRACELHAIAIQDRVLLGGQYPDSHYRARREGAFFVAINCGEAGGTCFCQSMNTGPAVESGYDISLTEIVTESGRSFVTEAGSEAGLQVLAALPRRPAMDEEIAQAKAVISRTAAAMGRQMRSDDLRELLERNLDHPRWDDVAKRCLTCGNCTMVCPTCFCTSVEDSSDLAGETASRSRRWDSCFTMDFSYIHGGSVRASARSRYRQWMTHKLAFWVDQFGTSGCVGCGRCITWCPVGIDITEEVRAIRDSGSTEG